MDNSVTELFFSLCQNLTYSQFDWERDQNFYSCHIVSKDSQKYGKIHPLFSDFPCNKCLYRYSSWIFAPLIIWGTLCDLH